MSEFSSPGNTITIVYLTKNLDTLLPMKLNYEWHMTDICVKKYAQRKDQETSDKYWFPSLGPSSGSIKASNPPLSSTTSKVSSMNWKLARIREESYCHKTNQETYKELLFKMHSYEKKKNKKNKKILFLAPGIWSFVPTNPGSAQALSKEFSAVHLG